MSTISTGQRLYSAVSAAEVIVVKAADVELHCGGQPMLPSRAEAVAGTAAGDPIAVGKRYTDAESGLLVLCTKGGAGPLTANGRDLSLVQAKSLPSSD